MNLSLILNHNKFSTHFYCAKCKISFTVQHFNSKAVPRTYEGAGVERKYKSYLFTTSALDGGEWSASRPSCILPPGKRPMVPIGQEAGWASEPVWTQTLEEKSYCLCRGSNCDRPVVQSLVRQYTD
jgi:hypothetical protein